MKIKRITSLREPLRESFDLNWFIICLVLRIRDLTRLLHWH